MRPLPELRELPGEPLGVARLVGAGTDMRSMFFGAAAFDRKSAPWAKSNAW
jgi:hypothetical protein